MVDSIYDIAGDQARRRRAQESAQAAADLAPDLGWFGGFITSAVSSLPELAGMDPAPAADRFRLENPWAGLGSQLIGIGGPYVGAYRLSRTATGARALSATMGRTGISAAQRPILYGAVNEMVRFAPLEVSRLALGAAFAPPENMGDLFADVGLSFALTGGIGGIGGLFRAGGQAARTGVGRVTGADFRLAPTAEFRLGLQEGATANRGEIAERLSQLRAEILTETAPRAGRASERFDYLHSLEGGTREELVGLRALFRPNSATARPRSVDRRLLFETAEGNARGLNPGQAAEVYAATGLDADTFLSHAFYPRVVGAADDRGASSIARLLESPAMRSVGEGTLMGMEEGGQAIIVKRLASPGREANQTYDRMVGDWRTANPARRRPLAKELPGLPARVRAFGRAEVHAGDRYLILKTDRPGLFVPQAELVGNKTAKQWANWRQEFKPHGQDIFSQATDQLLQAMTPLDIDDITRLGRKTWVAQMSQRLTQRATDAAGVTDSLIAKNAAEWAWDTFAPTMFQEGKNTLFGRFFGLLNNGTRLTTEVVNRIMRGEQKFAGAPMRVGSITFGEGLGGGRPVEAILRQLSEDELGLIYRAAVTQTPADDLARLVDNPELLSPLAKEAVRELQAINQSVVRDILIPAFDNSRMRERYSFLEGYLLPRLWRGDWRLPVVDEAGREVHLASGRNAGEAAGEAKAVIDEAARRGINLREGKGGLAFIAEITPDELGRITGSAAARLGESQEMMDVVRTALRQINILKSSTGKNLPIPGNPSTLRARKGRSGTPDVWTPSHGEVARQIEAHYTQLMRFANDLVWRERFGSAMLSWGKAEPTMYNNLMRKANQLLGIEGQITNVLNKTLQPLLGPIMGSKPATRIAQALNEVMYDFNLAILNPTFALLNLLTPLQTVAPWIAYTTRAATHEVERTMQLSLVMDNAGRVRGSTWQMSPMKVLGEAWKMARQPTEELSSFLTRALNDNTLKAQLFEDWVGPKSRGAVTLRDSFQRDGYVGLMRTGIKWMAERSEQFSRLIAFNSAYLVGKNHFGLVDDALYRFARRGTEVTMYNYGTVDRARIMTGPIGSVFGLFKNWQMHFMGNMINYAGLAIRENTWSPLLWQTATAGALGGLGATPLKHLADGLANWHSEHSTSFLWLQENWSGAADEIYFGLPAFLGVSLQASSVMPGTDVRNDVSSLGNIVVWERARLLAQALGDGWNIQQATGQSMLRDPNIVDRMVQATMPRAVSRVVSSVEGDYIRSMRSGYPQVRGLSPAERMMHGLGFNVTDIERYQVAGRQLWDRQQDRQAWINGLGQQFAQAQLINDHDAMTQTIQRAIIMQLPVSSVLRSAQTVHRRETEGDLTSRYDEADVGRYVTALQRSP